MFGCKGKVNDEVVAKEMNKIGEIVTIIHSEAVFFFFFEVGETEFLCSIEIGKSERG